MAIVILVLFACGLNTIMVQGWQDTLNGITINVKEKSGRITISNGNNSLSIAFKEIAEFAMNGVTPVGTQSPLKHTYKNFEFQVFDEGGPAQYVEVATETEGNITVFKKNFTAKLYGPAADFTIEVWVFGNDTIIQNSNSPETYQVYNGTVKLAFSLDNWKFCGINDTACLSGSHLEYGYFLDVSASIRGGAASHEDPKVGILRGNSEVEGRIPNTYDYGGGDVCSSQMYQLNYTWNSMTPDFPKLRRKIDHFKKILHYEVIRFPVFHSPIYYNMFVNISSQKYTSSSWKYNNSPLSYILVSILTFICTWYIH